MTRLPWWLQIQWGGDMPCAFMYIGPLLIAWDRPKHYHKGWYWPRDISFAWNPD